MKIKMAIFILFGLWMVSARAEIARSTLEQDQQNLVVSLTPNVVAIQVQDEQKNRIEAMSSQTQMEVTMSSWAPQSLSLQTLVKNAGAFQSVLPQTAVHFYTPIATDLSLKYGVQFSLFGRTARVIGAGLNVLESQYAYLPSGVAGVEYTPNVLSTHLVQPYLAATALPSLLFTNRSALHEGETNMGLLGEFDAGILLKLSNTWLINMSASQTVGKIQKSNLQGFGVKGGVRVSL